jgi:hypothetical protein
VGLHSESNRPLRNAKWGTHEKAGTITPRTPKQVRRATIDLVNSVASNFQCCALESRDDYIAGELHLAAVLSTSIFTVDCHAPVYFIYGCRFTSSGAKRATPSALASRTLILAPTLAAAPLTLGTKLTPWNA